MKQLILLVLFIFTGLGLWAEMLQLPNLTKAQRIRVDEKQIYIVEGAHIYIHSTADLRLIRKIGRKGEGPREFAIH
ncbi:MAG: hypothetical protein GY765_27385, partial [bacterium]|nr:hypothetical protein [bacterium]